MKHRWIALIGLGILTTLFTDAFGQSRSADLMAPSPEKLELITTFFANEVATGKLPGAVILIQQHGRPVYLKSFGVQDTRASAPMSPDTIFAIKSMSKAITCLAAMMLVDEGKLSLSDPIYRYIPSFAGVEMKLADGTSALELVPLIRPVTILDMMRQTSGISYSYIGANWVEKVYTEANLFAGHFDNREFAERIAKLRLTRQPARSSSESSSMTPSRGTDPGSSVRAGREPKSSEPRRRSSIAPSCR